MNINLKGVFLGCKFGIPALQRAGGGSIINTASFVALLGAATPQLAYTASKGGVLAMTRTLAIEWAPKVRVCAITPGLVWTEQSGDHYPDPDAIAATVPMGRFGTPQDIAGACLFLASDSAAYASGANLVLDGGGEWPAFLRPKG